MGKSLEEIAEELKFTNKKTQLIYGFNGNGKTRLSREFKNIIEAQNDLSDEDEKPLEVLYYNAFTEDLFYWDNDLENNEEPKLKIQPNSFTKWIFEDQGKEQSIIANFQHYTNDKLTPMFNEEYIKKDDNGNDIRIKAFSEITFSYQRGNDEVEENIKISKGEESNFIWSIFFTLIEQVVDVLNVAEPSERETNQFDDLEYIFIDDPVSSLDENHLIELAVDLASLIKKSKSEVKFIITTHNPLFYNVLHNELRGNKYKKYFLKKREDRTYIPENQADDSPFSYHLYLLKELERAIESREIHKYHYNFLRNILEKTSTFLGYKNWGELLPSVSGGNSNPYEARIINISSHSKHAAEEIYELNDNDKRVLQYLVKEIKDKYNFQLVT